MREIEESQKHYNIKSKSDIFKGVGGYCICYARKESQGANVQADPEVVKMTQSSQGANVRS